MSALIAQYGLLVVAVVIFAGEIGIPTLVPGEIALLLAGNTAIHSVPMLIASVVVLGAVDLVATTSIHLVARTGGNRLLVRVLRMMSHPSKPPELVLERCRKRLGGYDPAVVFVTRLIPMFRLYASITTGLIRIRLRSFLTGAAAAAWLWVSIPLTIGFVLRSEVGSLTADYPSMMNYVLLGSISIAALVGCCGWLRHAGSREAAVRRGRFILGMVAATGALTRILTFVLHDRSVAGHHFATPLNPGLSVILCFAGLAGLALLWVAGHDLRIICTRHCRPGFGAASGFAWVSLLSILAAALAAAGPAFI